MDLLNKKPTFDGGLAQSNPNLDPETAHRLDPLAERFAFITLSGKIPLSKDGQNLRDTALRNFSITKTAQALEPGRDYLQDHYSVLILMAKVLGIG